METKFSLYGMTCESCVNTIKHKLDALPGVDHVDVNLAEKSVTFHSSQNIQLKTAQQALSDLPKYSVSELTQAVPTTPIEESKLKTYRPLIVLFIYILLSSAGYQIFNGQFDGQTFMNHLMAGFFLGLSFFKFLDLKAFAESFSSYDPIAQRFLRYGSIYPFVELALGFLFISGVALLLANTATVIILTVTTIGVLKRLRSKTKFQCACLGTTFSLPLSYVTVSENVAMIIMAGVNIMFL